MSFQIERQTVKTATNKIPNLIHIGLPKTATTMLQQIFFPKLECIKPELQFNSQIILNNLPLIHQNSNDAKKAIQQELRKGGQIISSEHLANWNPHHWELAAERNLELFGYESHILITLRDTQKYLRSSYQQVIKQQNIMKPSLFFVDQETYAKIENNIPYDGLFVMDYTNVKYKELLKIYTNRFAKVYILQLSDLPTPNDLNLQFLEELYNLPESDVRVLKDIARQHPSINKSYSEFAMSATFYRENFLNFFGLQSKGSFDTDLRIKIRGSKNLRKASKRPKWTTLTIGQKVLQFPLRVFRNVFVTMTSWRLCMELISKGPWSCKEYELPKHVKPSAQTLEDNNKILLSARQGLD